MSNAGHAELEGISCLGMQRWGGMSKGQLHKHTIATSLATRPHPQHPNANSLVQPLVQRLIAGQDVPFFQQLHSLR